jgi:predicted nuclease of predicted toxin-antitoxin system
MRFLANENFPFPSIRLLRQQGYEVVSICEELGGIKDELVLAKAVKEKLIILTFDRDYGELIFKYGLEPPPAVVYFRTKGQTPQDAANRLIKHIDGDGLALLSFFTVIEDNGIRQRKLK